MVLINEKYEKTLLRSKEIPFNILVNNLASMCSSHC